MVLRKQPPPRLENLHKGHARPNFRSPTSPSATSPQSRRLNQPPSQDSIYSPDLNTSPAFDLMPLEEAQRSPMGSPTNQPPSSWSEDRESRSSNTRPNSETYIGSTVHTVLPGTVVYGLPRVVEHDPHPAPTRHQEARYEDQYTRNEEVPVQLQSNNPFLQPRKPVPTNESVDPHGWNDRHSHATTSSEPLSQFDGYIPMTARLSLLDPAGQESPWADDIAHSDMDRTGQTDAPRGPSPWGSQHSIQISASEDLYLQGIQSKPYAPAVAVQPSESANDPYGLHPSYSHGRLGSDAGVHTPSAFSSATSATSHELIDLDPSDNIGMENRSEQAAAPGHAFPRLSGDLENSPAEPHSQMEPPALPQESQNTPYDQTPYQSRAPLSPAEQAKQQEQRSETYSIRHINWKDRSGNMIQSPILVQNKNGPCPLLALINAMVLRADQTAQPPIVKALQTREQISLGLLIEALFEELITRLGPDDPFPDIEALSQFLTILHTGMNVNPRLTLDTVDSLGSFLQTPDLQLYSTFGIPLIHGWLAPWPSPAHDAMTRVAQFHEDIQLLHFRKQEFEDQIMRDHSLSPEEEQKMADIHIIQYFVDVENKTQLSPFGLTQLSTKLAPGSVSIFFRNDHFSTLYKHPQSHQLYSLVTDDGYANHAEVVWESLVDVTGFNSEFFAGDFRAVSHGQPSGSEGPAGPRTSSIPPNNSGNDSLAPANQTSGRLSPQEQADADYAYALALQFQEEEQRERDSGQQGSDTQPPPPARSPNSSNPRMNNPSPRTSSNGHTVGIRPPREPHHDPDPDDPNAPPPPYEQAAGRQQYNQRPSRFTEFPSEYSTYPGNRYHRNGRYPNQGSRPENRYPPNQRDRDRDCILM
ncbi:hypothetical protein N7478_007436 [Penicillium angulare]|uniref:uncharacterized protein n=1 Tax=Penicillium angulare TaxID=116970 RepID=UPI002541D8B1|nr:uncharacterized protein N7478_007436 [Penicillium angulare]KAJ5272311.1 hypothetical protein N7478_007436 [Penicillium angulare]